MDFHQDRSGSVFPLVAVSDGTFSPSTVCNNQLYNYTYTYKTTQYTYRDTCRWASHVARAPACRGCTRSCRGSTPRPRGTCQGCTATGPRRSSARPVDTCHESRGQCHQSRAQCHETRVTCWVRLRVLVQVPPTQAHCPHSRDGGRGSGSKIVKYRGVNNFL